MVDKDVYKLIQGPYLSRKWQIQNIYVKNIHLQVKNIIIFLLKNIIKHYENIKLQMFPVASFYFEHFLILCNRDYGTYSIVN